MLAWFKSPNGLLPLRHEDLLLAAKAAQYEGGSADPVQAAAVIWTIAVRTAWFNAPSFAEMTHAFAQPLNPRWRADGDFCRPGGRYAATDHCSPARLARREKAAQARWGDLSQVAREAATAFFLGRLSNPVRGAADFASSTTAEAAIARGERVVAVYKGQVYFTEERAGVSSASAAWLRCRVIPNVFGVALFA